MHRHGYQGRKFGRERDQRRALIKSLASALIDNGAIETTVPKAKEVVPYVEKLITKAKKGDLHSRRQVIASLATADSAHKLFDEIAPKLGARSSGHLRIEKTGFRRGDLAPMGKVSFVDDLTGSATAQPTAKPVPETKPAKPVAKTAAKPKAEATA